MTKQLYEEALADVKKLKEVAEDNAKRALLEAVTPRIRDLIENQLLGELGEIEADPEDILKDEMTGRDPVSFEKSPVVVSPQLGDSASAAASMSLPDAEGKVTLDLDSLKADDNCGDEYELSLESVNSLGVLATSSGDSAFDSKLEAINKKLGLVNNTGKLFRESKGFEHVLSSIVAEVEDTYSYLQNNLQDCPKKSSYESILENYYSTLRQLTEQKMKKNQRTLSEADVTLKLTGMPDDLDLESLGVDLITGEEEDEEAGEESEEAGEDAGDDLDLGGEGSDEELDLGDEEDEEKEESVAYETKKLSDDTVVEIDEAMLRREIGRMKALREAADMPKNAAKGNGPGDVSDDFEDDDLGDPFTDVELTTESAPSHRSVMYSHPDLPAMGKMSGKVERDDFEGTDMFYPDAKHHADLLKKYGYEPEAGLYLDGATLDEADKMDHVDELDEMSKEVDETYGEVDEMEEMEQSYHQATDHSNDDPQTNKQNRMPESLRRRIADEMKLQTEAKAKAMKAKKAKQVAEKEEKQAKTQAKKKQAKTQANKMKEAYNFFATKFNESVARSNKLKGMLSEAVRKGAALNGTPKSSAAETDLRNKLAETNLFNAKLLFTNKLLQNESLTKRQKAEVIERLDEAKNEREVKLVYESLVKTLSASTTKITESTDRGVIGSASRPSRPASSTNSLNEGFESDRWARLAGIVK
jgi:hypothetical protein